MPGYARHLIVAIVLVAATLAGCGDRASADRVPDDPRDVGPLIPGMRVPAFSAMRPDRSVYRLSPDAMDGPVVITFYRGGWCPYCSRHLMDYRAVEDELRALGYTLLFISPDSPETSARHLEGGDFEYTLLSDSEMTISRAFGLAFRLDDATFTRYLEQHDIDIERDSGQLHHYLPVPATYIVGADGVIDFMYANPDYRTRLNPDLLREAARLALDEATTPAG